MEATVLYIVNTEIKNFVLLYQSDHSVIQAHLHIERKFETAFENYKCCGGFTY